MLKQIHIDQLRVGMFVDQVDRGELDSPLIRKQITSPEEIESLRANNVESLRIDTTRGIDVQTESREGAVAVAEAEASIPRESAAPADGERSVVSREFREEIESAKEAYAHAIDNVHDVMIDARSGKYLHEEATRVVVSELVDSCMRNDDALVSLAKLLAHDEYTFTHSVNVTVFSLALGKSIGMSRDELQGFGESVLLHDVGKMLIPSQILNKPGRLSPEEYDVMKLHVERGVQLIRESFPDRDDVSLVAAQHHERFDGSGYPNGLRSQEISKWGQVCSVADVYDALTSKRCYKGALTPHRAMSLIFRLRGNDFNSLYVEKFVECVGIYPIGSLVRLDTGEIGLIVSIRHDDLLRPDVLALYRNGSHLARPRIVDLRERGAHGEHARRIEDILNPEDFGINPADHILEQ